MLPPTERVRRGRKVPTDVLPSASRFKLHASRCPTRTLVEAKPRRMMVRKELSRYLHAARYTGIRPIS